jgi:hypothetical protein
MMRRQYNVLLGRITAKKENFTNRTPKNKLKRKINARFTSKKKGHKKIFDGFK